MPSTAAAPVREAKLIQLVVLRLADEEFAIPIGEVREIIRNVEITPVPGSPEFITGMINVRGEIAAVIDLKKRFGLRGADRPKPKHIVITAQGKNLFALLVDEVAEILRIGADEVRRTPDLAAKVEESLAAGFVVRGDRLIVMLDLVKTLSEEALARTLEAARRAPS